MLIENNRNKKEKGEMDEGNLQPYGEEVVVAILRACISGFPIRMRHVIISDRRTLP